MQSSLIIVPLFRTSHRADQKVQSLVLPGYHSIINQYIAPTIQRYVKLRDAEREPEVLLADVYLMEVVGGARNLGATKELRVVLCTARPMEVAGDVNSLVAQRVQKGVQISALPMVVAEDAVTKVVPELPGGNLDYVFVMGVARDAREKIVPRVQKACQVSASHMGEVVDAKLLDAQKGPRGAQCSAKHMVGVNGVRPPGAPRVLREAPPFVRAMVEENAVHTKVVEFAVKACMEGPTSVWHMAVERGVLFLAVQRAQEDGLIIVSAMAVGRDASLKGAERVHKEAPTFARHMGVARDALGAILGQNLASNQMVLVIHLPGGKLVCVHFIVDKCMIRGFMVVSLWDQLFRILILVIQMN